MRPFVALATSALALGAALGVAGPAAAHGDHARPHRAQSALAGEGGGALLESGNVTQLSSDPSQVGISGCFMRTAPVFVTSGARLGHASGTSATPPIPRSSGALPNVQFENEAMNCGERRRRTGTQRFALIGVDSSRPRPTTSSTSTSAGGELIVVDVTDPANPAIRSRTPGTHQHPHRRLRDLGRLPLRLLRRRRATDFSIFDLTDLDHPREVDSDPARPASSRSRRRPPGHKWNFDAAGFGTHTGCERCVDVRPPTRRTRGWSPPPVARAGATTRRYPGWNDFIHHNSFRPNAEGLRAGQPRRRSRTATCCWSPRRTTSRPTAARPARSRPGGSSASTAPRSAIVPLDKVELSDLGSFPLPQGAFCSSHWFDYRPGGHRRGRLLRRRHPADRRRATRGTSKPYGHAVWGASEVWDSMWVPVYDRTGHQTGAKSNVVYSIDLVRGLDVYAVDVPGRRDRAPCPRPSAGARAPRPSTGPATAWCRWAWSAARWRWRSPCAAGAVPADPRPRGR